MTPDGSNRSEPLFAKGGCVDAALQTQLTVAALVCSIVALLVSLSAAFPGLKDLLAVIRDGVLWFALVLVLGGVGFVVWQHLEKTPKLQTRPATSASVEQASPLAR
jgi:hypothetical protein